MVCVTEMSTLGCLLCHTTETKTATHPYTPHCERSKGEDGGTIIIGIHPLIKQYLPLLPWQICSSLLCWHSTRLAWNPPCDGELDSLYRVDNAWKILEGVKTNGHAFKTFNLPVMTQGSEVTWVWGQCSEATYVPLSSVGSSCSTLWSIETANTHSFTSSRLSSWKSAGKINVTHNYCISLQSAHCS